MKMLFNIVLVTGVLCVLVDQTSAMLDVPKTPQELREEAELILQGTVTEIEALLHGGGIVSFITLEDLTLLKGQHETPTYIVQVLGGTVDGETLEVKGAPEFRIGETYLLYIRGNGEWMFPFVGGSQGVRHIRRDPDTGETPSVRSLIEAERLPQASRKEFVFLRDNLRHDRPIVWNVRLEETRQSLSAMAPENVSAIFREAAEEWNAVGIGPDHDHQFFSFLDESLDADPCVRNDGINTVGFVSGCAGLIFGDVAAAFASRWPGGDGEVSEADIFVDSTREFGIRFFVHLALHELGHVVGCDHPDEDGQTVMFVMNTGGPKPISLQSDDIACAHNVPYHPIRVAEAPSAVSPILTELTVTPRILDQGIGTQSVTVTVRAFDEDGDLKKVKVIARFQDGTKAKATLRENGTGTDASLNSGQFTGQVKIDTRKSQHIFLEVKADKPRILQPFLATHFRHPSQVYKGLFSGGEKTERGIKAVLGNM